MRQPLHWLSPGDPAQLTGGYLYNARVISVLCQRGWEVQTHVLHGQWPWPGDADLQGIADVLGSIPQGEPVLADGLLWPGLGPLRERVCSRHPVAVLVHSLLDKEDSEDPERLIALEAEALGQARGWIATSPATARLVRQRMRAPIRPGRVVCPGTEPASRAQGSGGRQLLTVATVTPRKDILGLVQAASALTVQDWHLNIVGSLQRAPDYAQRVRAEIQSRGLSDRVRLMGELDGAALEAAFAEADLLVHTASFESFGMVLSEAIARGIPVLSTPAGALEVLPEGAIQEVPVGQPQVWAHVLNGLLGEPESLHKMADVAADAVLPTWQDAASEFESALAEVL